MYCKELEDKDIILRKGLEPGKPFSALLLPSAYCLPHCLAPAFLADSKGSVNSSFNYYIIFVYLYFLQTVISPF